MHSSWHVATYLGPEVDIGSHVEKNLACRRVAVTGGAVQGRVAELRYTEE